MHLFHENNRKPQKLFCAQLPLEEQQFVTNDRVSFFCLRKSANGFRSMANNLSITALN